MYYDAIIHYISYDSGSPKLMTEHIRSLSYAEFLKVLSGLDSPPIKVEMNVKFF